jgi:hypothetical protein
MVRGDHQLVSLERARYLKGTLEENGSGFEGKGRDRTLPHTVPPFLTSAPRAVRCDASPRTSAGELEYAKGPRARAKSHAPARLLMTARIHWASDFIYRASARASFALVRAAPRVQQRKHLTIWIARRH